MNNKGFTLIELLGVIVVLVLILLVAIPTITTTYQKNKNKKIEEQKEIIIGAAEIYISTSFNSTKKQNFFRGGCYIYISYLTDKDLLTLDEIPSFDPESDNYVVMYKDDLMQVVERPRSNSGAKSIYGCNDK